MEFHRQIMRQIFRYMDAFPAAALLGPRQIGKTFTAKEFSHQYQGAIVYLDLESDADVQKLKNAEQYFLERDNYLIVIDEIQRNPSLFVLLRSVIDKNRTNGRFLLLGSASPELLAQSSETLAGRVAYLEMHPLFFREVQETITQDELWLKGGFPEMLQQKDLELSFEMRIQFIQSYLERELPILGLFASSVVLKNLLRMIAHNQGQVVNYTELSKSLGLDIKTVKRYLDYFENSYLIRRVEPYFTNTKKRLVRSPKMFIRDTGLLHCLFNVVTKEDLDGFNGKGNSWESFVIQQVIGQLKTGVSAFFYRTQDGSELDLVLVKGMSPILGLEIKLSNAPRISKGTTISSQDLGNIPVFVVTHSVDEDYKHNERVTVTSFSRLFFHLEAMKLLEKEL